MEILLTMVFGLILRFVLSEPAQTHNKIYPAIMGVWEGTCLRYLTYRSLPVAGSTADPFLSYCVRLCIDFFITDSFAQVLAIALWSFLGALAWEALESGNSETVKRAPLTLKESSGTSFARIHNVAQTSPFLFSPSTASPAMESSPPFSSTEVYSNPDVLAARSPPIAALPPEPSEFSEIRSSVTHGSYTLSHPALVPQQSHDDAHDPSGAVETSPDSSPTQSLQSAIPIPILMLDDGQQEQEQEQDNDNVDELQTPLHRDDIGINPDDQDEDPDELQTPLALPVANIGFGNSMTTDEPPELDLGPMLLGSSRMPIRSSSASPIPVPAPTLLQSTLLESPLSTLHSLSPATSSPGVSSPASILSVLSDANPTQPDPVTLRRMYARAEELRKQAWKEDRAKTQLEIDLASAKTQGRTRDVFMLTGEIKAAKERIERLHMRAKRRYYYARNSSSSSTALQTLEIDVHGLLVGEAVEETEEAFRDVLRNGHRFLRVIVGRGNHSRDRVPKLKPAIMQVMSQYGFKCTVDYNNAGVIILEAPAQ